MLHTCDWEYHKKWDTKSDEWIFLGYSQNNRVDRVFNKRTKTVIETINVIVNDNEKSSHKCLDDDKLPYVNPP